MSSERQIFLSKLAQTNEFPLMLEVKSAKGNYIYDTEGKRYLDLISGISVNYLGHHHPAVITALKKQLDDYSHVMVYGEFIQSPQTEYAELLTSHLPENLSNIYFVNSGSEATEGAMKLAKRYTGRSEILYFDSAYHGSTQGALSLAGGEELKRNFRPLLPAVHKLTFNSGEELDRITEETAAVIIEPVQGEAGARASYPCFLRALRERCYQTGTLLIFDEIQCGFGRTGSLWSFESYAVVPDILLLGKALGGGLPLGAFISSKEIMSTLMNDPVLGHISTFGGHPLSCKAGYASLNEALKTGILMSVIEKGILFKSLVYEKIGTVKGKGLLLSLQLGSFERVERMIHYLFQNNVISDWFVFNNTSIRIAPPYTISTDEIQSVCELINAFEE